MIDFTGFSQGFGQRRQDDRRRRRDMAQAFQEFRNANPYASAEEFQDFIDRYSGGRNYIAGGAPSKDVLRNIATENQERRARDEMARRMDDLRTRAQTMSSLEAMADTFLLNYDGDDLEQARQEFGEQLGLGDAPLPGGINPGSLITDTRRTALASSRARELLPQALDLIRESEGKIDAKTLRTVLPDIPPAVVNPLIEQAQSEYEQEQDALALQREERVGTAKQGLLDRVQSDTRFQSALRSGNERMARDILRTRINNLPTDVREAIGDDWIDSVLQGEVQLLREEQEALTREREERVSAAKQELLNRVQGDTRFQSALRSGNELMARDILQTRINNLPTDVREAIGDDWIYSVLRGEVQLLREVQRNNMAETRREASGAAVEARQTYSEANLNRVTSHFGTPDEPFPTAGPASGGAILAAQQLSQEFDINRTALFVLENAFANADKDMSTEELYTLGRQALEDAARSNLVRTADQGRQQAVEVARRTLGDVGPIRSFDDYVTGTLDAIDTKWTDFETALSQASQIEDPQERRQRLKTIRTAWNQAMSAALQATRQDRATSDQWLEIGSGDWDQSRIEGDSLDSVRGRLLSYQQRLEQRLAEVSAGAPPPARPAGVAPLQGPGPQRAELAPPPQDTGEPSTERSAAAEMASDIGDSVVRAYGLLDASNEVGRAVGLTNTTGDVLGAVGGALVDPLGIGRRTNEFFFMSESERERRVDLRDYVEQVHTPLAYLLEYSADDAYRQTLLEDLRTMGRQEFERKYAADITRAAEFLRSSSEAPAQDDQ